MSTLSKTLGPIVDKKPVAVADAGRTVEEALKVMEQCASHAIGVTVSGYFTGLFTTSDLVKKVIRQGRNPRTTRLYEVMTINPLTVSRNCDFREAFYYLCRYSFSSLPVVEDGKFYGIVSEEDLRHEIASSLKQMTTENQMLMSYIKGESYGFCAG